MNFSDNGTVFIVPTALHLNRHATTTVDGQTGTCNFFYSLGDEDANGPT